MSKEVTFILEPDNGKVTTEVSGISTGLLAHLRDDLGASQNVNCGKPLERDAVTSINQPESSSDDSQFIWLYRIYHDSVVDGPGRRSVVQVAGCSIRCTGCYVPETHDQVNGKKVPISYVVSEVLKEKDHMDGVTILGGEPFDQSSAVAELVARLKLFGLNVTVYSGYTIEALIDRKVPSIEYILTHIDSLIDGPFILSETTEVGEYRGSGNQRLIGTAKPEAE